MQKKKKLFLYAGAPYLRSKFRNLPAPRSAPYTPMRLTLMKLLYFRYSKHTSEELYMYVEKQLYRWQYWNSRNLKTLNSIKNPKNTFRFNLGQCRSMRGWLLIEENPHCPTSFLLVVPLPHASYVLHENSNRSDNYLLTNFIIYQQIHTLTFSLNLSLPCSCKIVADRSHLSGWAPMYL